MQLVAASLLLAVLASFAPHPRTPRRAPHPPAPAPDSTTVRLLYGSANADLNELMGRVLNIEKHRLLLHDRRLAGRRLRITYQEYRQGVAGPEKPLTTNASLLQLDSAGRLPLTVYAHATADGKVENTFILPRASINRAFTPVAGDANHYSLLFDMHPYRLAADQTGTTPGSPAEEFKLPLSGGPTILAVYTLPYQKGDMYYYCGLAQSRVPVAEWYGRFRVPHYVVYRAQLQ